MRMIEVFAVFIIILAMWRKDIFLYFMAAPVAMVAGLSWRGVYGTDVSLVISIMLVGIGLYCMILGIYNIVRKQYEQ